MLLNDSSLSSLSDKVLFKYGTSALLSPENRMFSSKELKLYNLTVSKILLKENHCGGCYNVWKVKKKVPVTLNLFDNRIKI